MAVGIVQRRSPLKLKRHDACMVSCEAKLASMVQVLTFAPLSRAPQLSPFIELKQSLASRVTDISPFVDQLMRFIMALRHKFCNQDGREPDIEIAVQEALANAVIQGNGENPEKRVYVTCRCSMDGELSITVRDQGQALDERTLWIRQIKGTVADARP